MLVDTESILLIVLIVLIIGLICVAVFARSKTKERAMKDNFNPKSIKSQRLASKIGVIMLNTSLIWPNVNMLEHGSERAEQIATWIRTRLPEEGVSFVLLQEAFVPQWTEILYEAFKSIGWSYTVPVQGNIASSGLICATPFKISKKIVKQFKLCSGPCCLANKGFVCILCAGTLVCNVHLQDGDFDDSFNIRSKQITEVIDTVSSIKARNVLIAGDFNTSAKRMRVFLTKYPQFKISCVNDEDIDYVIYSGFETPNTFYHEDVGNVSDHKAVMTILKHSNDRECRRKNASRQIDRAKL